MYYFFTTAQRRVQRDRRSIANVCLHEDDIGHPMRGYFLQLGDERRRYAAPSMRSRDGEIVNVYLAARLFELAGVWSPGPERYRGLEVFAGLRYIDIDLSVAFDPANPAFNRSSLDGSDSSPSTNDDGNATESEEKPKKARKPILPPITPYYVMKVGHVPLIPYHRPGDPAVAEFVADTIRSRRAAGGRLTAVMLERLGPNVWGASPAAAMATLEELEETAKLWLLSEPRPAPLEESAIEELRRAFDAPW